ncbi:uncharacterized protein [Coffea arabica]|uniref:Uncharacterized protein isoform X2 n=1 Tax=Coffea arabica TaxID=13443 RepID=A0ABM4V1V8_COFAR
MTTRIAPGVGANLLGQHSAERNQDATAYVGNLDPQVSEELLWELFVQAGPVVNVYVPKDRVTNSHQGYGFVEFRSEEDADYAIKVLNMIKLYGKPIRVNKASQDKKSVDVGANLFIGNLDPDVDEKLLYDTFSAFGVIVTNPKIMRDPETGNSRGFGFISYDSFEASDAAIECLMRTRKTQRASVMVPLQKEYWLLVIQMCRKADHTPCLQADLLHFKMLLKQVLTLLLLSLHGLLLMGMFLQHPFHHSDHHLHRLPCSRQCHCLHHNHGRVNNHQVKLPYLHLQCSSSGACRLHLHKLLQLYQGLHHHQ